MNLIDINLADEPVTISEFKYFSSEAYPKVILGCKIHNKYDQERIKIPKKIKSENILHIQTVPHIQFNFFRGISINPTKKYGDLIDNLNDNTLNDLKSYQDILKINNLSCDDCFSFFQPNIYPINGSCLDSFVGENGKLKKIYNNIFEKNKKCFQCYESFNIFILTNNYKSDTFYEDFLQQEENICA